MCKQLEQKLELDVNCICQQSFWIFLALLVKGTQQLQDNNNNNNSNNNSNKV